MNLTAAQLAEINAFASSLTITTLKRNYTTN